MSGIGSFSQDAYEQLKEAYAQQLLLAEEAENAGVKVGQDTLGVETAPVRSVWLNKTGLWKYPDGRGAYVDNEQKQQDLLAALRNESGDVEFPDDSTGPDLNLDELSEEELDALIDSILNEIDNEEEEEEEEEEEVGEEELDKLLNEILDEIENGNELSEKELKEIVDEILADGEDDEETELSAADISARIQELRAELASLAVDSEEDEDEEYEPEETQGTEEETDSKDELIAGEGATFDDEPA